MVEFEVEEFKEEEFKRKRRMIIFYSIVSIVSVVSILIGVSVLAIVQQPNKLPLTSFSDYLKLMYSANYAQISFVFFIGTFSIIIHPINSVWIAGFFIIIMNKIGIDRFADIEINIRRFSITSIILLSINLIHYMILHSEINEKLSIPGYTYAMNQYKYTSILFIIAIISGYKTKEKGKERETAEVEMVDEQKEA